MLVLLTVGQRQLICSYIHRFNVPLALGLATRHVLVCNPSKVVIDILRVILHSEKEVERIVASSVQLQNVEQAWIGREMRTTASTLSDWVYLTVLPTNSSIFREQYTRVTIKVELSKFILFEST